jgi:hypothetical protein
MHNIYTRIDIHTHPYACFRFAFVELRTSEEASRAVTGLDGIEVRLVLLKGAMVHTHTHRHISIYVYMYT